MDSRHDLRGDLRGTVGWLLKAKMFPNAPPEMFHFAFIGPVFIAAGGVASMASLEIDFGNGAIHFAFYLLVSVLFCFIIGVPAY